jgi:TP901 family phage tail tape measure protein
VGRSIFVTLRAAVSGYVGDMAKAGAATRKVADDMGAAGVKGQQSLTEYAKAVQQNVQRNRDSLNTLSNQAAIAGTALTAVAGMAVKSYADFDQAMSHVAATGKDAVANIDGLREAAMAAGQATQFSATEAANGVEELAKAGVSAADIMGGGLAGSLDLAASGGLGVADAAEIAATAMTQFNLTGDKVGHVADLLAAGASEAQGSVGDLGAALRQSGLVANQTGLSIEETTAALTAFASAGLVGSDAGTSLKSMLQRLTPQSEEARKEMERLGISAYDSSGEFIGLSQFAGNLQSSLSGLTTEQRNAALATIFGSDAVRAANVLYQEGSAGIAEWTEKVDQAGFASETAATRMDNLKGDVEQLGGALETAFINMGEGADGPLRSLTQWATDAVNKFSELPSWVQGASLAIVGGGGLALLGVAGLMRLVSATSDGIDAMQRLGIMSQATAGRVGAVGVAAARVAGAAGALLAITSTVGLITDRFASAAPEAERLSQSLNDMAHTGDISELDTQFSGLSESMGPLGAAVGSINGIGDALSHAFSPGLTDRVTGFVDGIPGMTSYLERAEERFQGVDTALSNMVSSGNLDGARDAFDVIRRAADEQGISLEELRTKFPEYVAALEASKAGAEAAGDATDANATALDTYAGSMASGIATTEEYTSALEELIAAQAEAAGVVTDLWTAQNNLEVAYETATEAVVANGQTLDATSEKGRANRDALMGISTAGWELIDSMRANGASQAELQGQVQATRDRFVAAAEAMGMSKEEANRLADSLNLIPNNVNVDVNANTANARANVDQLVANINARVATIQVRATMPDLNGAASGSGRLGTFARGGEVPYMMGAKPGKDSVRALLMPGEHVLTVDDVNAMGGQAAVYDWRKSLHGYANGGEVRRYANGGSVGSASALSYGSGYGSHMTEVSRTLAVQVDARGGASAGDIARRTVERLMDMAAVSPGVAQAASGVLG